MMMPRSRSMAAMSGSLPHEMLLPYLRLLSPRSLFRRAPVGCRTLLSSLARSVPPSPFTLIACPSMLLFLVAFYIIHLIYVTVVWFSSMFPLQRQLCEYLLLDAWDIYYLFALQILVHFALIFPNLLKKLVLSPPAAHTLTSPSSSPPPNVSSPGGSSAASSPASATSSSSSALSTPGGVEKSETPPPMSTTMSRIASISVVPVSAPINGMSVSPSSSSLSSMTHHNSNTHASNNDGMVRRFTRACAIVLFMSLIVAQQVMWVGLLIQQLEHRWTTYKWIDHALDELKLVSTKHAAVTPEVLAAAAASSTTSTEDASADMSTDDINAASTVASAVLDADVTSRLVCGSQTSIHAVRWSLLCLIVTASVCISLLILYAQESYAALKELIVRLQRVRKSNAATSIPSVLGSSSTNSSSFIARQRNYVLALFGLDEISLALYANPPRVERKRKLTLSPSSAAVAAKFLDLQTDDLLYSDNDEEDLEMD